MKIEKLRKNLKITRVEKFKKIFKIMRIEQEDLVFYLGMPCIVNEVKGAYVKLNRCDGNTIYAEPKYVKKHFLQKGMYIYFGDITNIRNHYRIKNIELTENNNVSYTLVPLGTRTEIQMLENEIRKIFSGYSE